MTETTEIILKKYQVRKTKAQKTAFIEYIRSVAAEMGYSSKIEIGRAGERNIVIGNPKHARVLFTAHYDTPPVMPMPNLITPKNIFLYILYQLLMTSVLMLLPAFLVGLLAYFVMTGLSVDPAAAYEIAFLVGYGAMISALILIMFGPANKHNANDNTSGLTTLVDIMRDLPPDLRDDAAFVFFDLEERGLVGSASFYKAHKDFMKDKLVVNFDCVGEGDNFLFVLRRGARGYAEVIGRSYQSTERFSVEVATRGCVYPSDQASFPVGVGVAALKKTRGGILYMNKIHTARDIVYNEENIEYLKDGSINLIKALSENKI